VRDLVRDLRWYIDCDGVGSGWEGNEV